ncbi:unnamed protein product [Prorocentrum cordatum]|uniref:Ubiquitin-like protease family profile domain-containing protein n=1 Tax=Prorocentrum cordatum TaxID=2364126 RepID=A0ABN9WXN7_9DINO|nr:unnamed protein product [Polarella glacialis]
MPMPLGRPPAAGGGGNEAFRRRPAEGFSAAGFGKVVHRQLRGARDAILARAQDREVGHEGEHRVFPRAQPLGGLLAVEPEGAGGCHWARPLGGPAVPWAPPWPAGGQAVTWASLPLASARSAPEAPSGGRELLWELPLARRAASLSPDADRPRTGNLGYLEYLAWLQRVMPESMLDSADAEAEQPPTEPHESGLELLRRLNAAARPKRPLRVPELTPEELELAERGLSGGPGGEVVASRFKVDVTRRQLECLRPGEWLNDEVINFYFQLLQERAKVGDKLTCWMPNSFFWPNLSGKDNKNYSYAGVRRWTIKQKVDIFSLQRVIFPMNICDTHWAMGAIDLRDKGFRYFDSMFSKPHPNFVPFLRRYLEDEHKAKKGGPLSGIEDWQLLEPDAPIPKQKNGYDCGVFTCNFAEFFSAGRAFAFTQEDMPNLRQRLAARVMKADENWT